MARPPRLSSGAVARRLFAPAIVGAMVVPALIVTLVLWRGFVIQIDESLHKRLTSSLSIMELVVTEGVEDFRAALARLAADNTLQVTVGLDIRPQMRRYLDKQFSLTQSSFIQILGLDGTSLAFVGSHSETELNCHGPADEITERVVAHDRELILVRAQPLAQNGATLGRLCAGFSLNRGAVAAAIASKFDGQALITWQGRAFPISRLLDSDAIEPRAAAGGVFDTTHDGTHYHGLKQAIPLVDEEIRGVVLVDRDDYDKASAESLWVVASVLVAVLLMTGFGLRMYGVRRRVEKQLLKEREKAVVTLSSIADGVLTTDAHGHISYSNPAAEKLLGGPSRQLVGSHLYDALELTSEENGQRLLDLRSLANTKGEIRFEDAVLKGPAGQGLAVNCSVAPINKDIPGDGAVITFRDTHRERELRRRLAWKASRDDLTGLRNRSEFRQKLEDLIGVTEGSEARHCLLYIDLDEFKGVNDTCGHHAGDQLLRQVSSSIQGLLRRSDIVARLGGDEFGVILYNCPSERGLEIAEDIIEIINDKRFHFAEKVFHVGASIGMVPITQDTQDIEDLLATVDAACYAAKEHGRNRVFLGEVDSAQILHRMEELTRASGIRQAIKEDRLVLYRQPIVSTMAPNSDQEVHAEVLVRMLDEEGGLVAPGAFIPIAERHGLMQEIDRWVIFNLLKTEAGRLRAWAPATDGSGVGRDFIYSINLSGASLTDKTFLEFVRRQLERFDIPGGAIAFEITETQIITHLDVAVEFIASLKELGCRFLLDDFGSGMSSFGYLKRLPVDYLKIDGLFVKDILADPIDRAMVKMINEIGHTMGLITIAEYVENPAILAKITEIGVDMAQGYGIAVPTPLTEERPALIAVS